MWSAKRAGTINASGVSDHVKDDLSQFLDGAGACGQDRRWVEMEWGSVGVERWGPEFFVAQRANFYGLQVAGARVAEKKPFDVLIIQDRLQTSTPTVSTLSNLSKVRRGKKSTTKGGIPLTMTTPATASKPPPEMGCRH